MLSQRNHSGIELETDGEVETSVWTLYTEDTNDLLPYSLVPLTHGQKQTSPDILCLLKGSLSYLLLFNVLGKIYVMTPVIL